MKVKQAEVTQATFDEWENLKRNQVCAECGNDLTIYTLPAEKALAFGCRAHPDAGFRQRTSYTEDYRRGAALPVTIKNAIERKSMDTTEFRRAVQLLAVRFPATVKDAATAALFIHDCTRLGLDPLIQPAEAVPVSFRTKDKDGKEKWTVAMVVTEDGALSMAARGCPGEYDGAPATMPLLDYLMREHKDRPMAELEVMSSRTAEELCGDAEAWVWVAVGKRRGADTVNPVYGYFTHTEREKALQSNLPAGRQPGNQARVRAVKRWVRETFPECRQRMLDYTAEIHTRSAGIIEAETWIDAEYTMLATPAQAAQQQTLQSPPGGNTGFSNQPKTARTPITKEADNKVSESAQRKPGPRAARRGGGSSAGQGAVGGGIPKTAAPSGADEENLFLDSNSPEMAKPSEAAAGKAGYISDLPWLYSTIRQIKWSIGTARSYIVNTIGTKDVPGENSEKTFENLLSTLSLEQTRKFTDALQKELDKRPKLL